MAKYDYDELDRRVKGQYFDVKWDYSYDQYNQLIGANNSNGDSYAYTYDPIGNRLKAIENGKERNFTYNSLNQISSDGYTYDAWGNMTRTPEAEYKYDLKNRLVEVKKKDGMVVSYCYDPLAQRIGSVVNGSKVTEFLMSGMVEYARNDGKTHYHTLGLDLFGAFTTGAVGGVLASDSQNYLYDGNGNVIATTIEKDKIFHKLSYTPYGEIKPHKNTMFSFSTKSIDASGLSYYGHRYYLNEIGKWTIKDSILEAGGTNLYSFVFNAPVNYVDRKGMVACPAVIVQPGFWSFVSEIFLYATGSTLFYEVTESISNTMQDYILNACGYCLMKGGTYLLTSTRTRTIEKPNNCKPCVPPVGTRGYRGPDYAAEHGLPNPHYHYYEMHQSPPSAGCVCFWHNLDQGGSVPIGDELTPAGGGGL